MKTEKYELMAMRLRKCLKNRGVDLSDQDSIDTVAFLLGYNDWLDMQHRSAKKRVDVTNITE